MTYIDGIIEGLFSLTIVVLFVWIIVARIKGKGMLEVIDGWAPTDKLKIKGRTVKWKPKMNI